jgi:hypothetical protein
MLLRPPPSCYTASAPGICVCLLLFFFAKSVKHLKPTEEEDAEIDCMYCIGAARTW